MRECELESSAGVSSIRLTLLYVYVQEVAQVIFDMVLRIYSASKEARGLVVKDFG